MATSIKPSAEEAMPIPFGVQAETGTYLPPIRESDLQHIGKDPASVSRRAATGAPQFGVTAEIDADDLAQAGWGILFPATMKSADASAVEQALQPLLNLRKKQAGQRYAIFKGETGYVPAKSADDWLVERGSGLNAVNPAQGVPYYLLLVGSPDDIPFDFQYDLDTFFAVGRIYFENTDEYRRYAENIVSFEESAPPQQKTIGLFVTRNEGDAATALLHDQIGTVLADGDIEAGLQPLGSGQGYQVAKFFAANASKSNLRKLLSGESTAGVPALLFTGSHGVAFAPDDPQLKGKQGAILTAEWGGPGSPVTPDTFLTADEFPADAKLPGTIHFFFACYSAGCPQFDTYSYDEHDQPVAIAGQTIIARLPQRMLLAGAQAVIGHIDRAWAYSFQAGGRNPMIQKLRDPLVNILKGKRVGDALDAFNQQWSVASGQLLTLIGRRTANAGSVPAAKLANKWTERDDARNYIVLGDPAARLQRAVSK